jgi:hypothetical protein
LGQRELQDPVLINEILVRPASHLLEDGR